MVLYVGRSFSCTCAGSATVSEQLYVSVVPLGSKLTAVVVQQLLNLEAAIKRMRKTGAVTKRSK